MLQKLFHCVNCLTANVLATDLLPSRVNRSNNNNNDATNKELCLVT